MKQAHQSDKFSPHETERRVSATLLGAFKGSPTQLKDIPRKPRTRRVKGALRKARKNA
jgi:hypothetical protein